MPNCLKSLLYKALCIGLLLPTTIEAWGLGFEAFGPAKQHPGVSPDWPRGAVPLRMHPSRVYWQEVNGNDRSYYDGDVEAINELLELYSQMNIPRHVVVLRAGRAIAKSFQGRATPYTVEFHLPGGLYLSHASERANSGLYPMSPRLFVNIHEELLTDIKKLKVPTNVQLHRHAYNEAKLIAAAQSGNAQAIRLLGEDGVLSSEARKIVEQAVSFDNGYTKAAANAALQQMDALAQKSKLRDAVTNFLDQHPQRYVTPKPKEVLAALHAADEKRHDEGFTAKGTLVDSSGRLMNWIATMGKEKLVIRQTAKRTDAIGQVEHTIFASKEHMGIIQRSQYWVDGKLTKSKPFLTREPVGNTLDLMIGRILWPVGISFSRRIDRVESVKEQADGTLYVVAFGDDNLGIRWELSVDPQANHLITQAKGYRTRDGSLNYIVDAAGVISNDGRHTNHTARWKSGPDAIATSISVHTVSSLPDISLIFEVEDEFAGDTKSER